jgi:hypothetical protein
LTIKQLSLSENALKLTYGNVEFQNFPGGSPLQGEGKGGREEWERTGWGGREEDEEAGREGVEGKDQRKGEGWKEKKKEGKRMWTPSRCSRQIDATVRCHRKPPSSE